MRVCIVCVRGRERERVDFYTIKAGVKFGLVLSLYKAEPQAVYCWLRW